MKNDLIFILIVCELRGDYDTRVPGFNLNFVCDSAVLSEIRFATEAPPPL